MHIFQAQYNTPPSLIASANIERNVNGELKYETDSTVAAVHNKGTKSRKTQME